MTRGSTAALFDYLIAENGLKNDADLGRELDRDSAYISKLRRGNLPLSANMILDIHEFYGMAVQEIRDRSGYQSRWRK